MKKRKHKTAIPQKKTYQKGSKKMLWGLDKCLAAAIQTSIDVGVPTARA